MTETEYVIRLKTEKKDADTFAEQVAGGIKKALDRLGLGSISKSIGGSKGGGAVAGVSQGITAGLKAAGIIGLLVMIADALADFPMVAAIMKIFKLILTILLLPLIPVLKPVLMLLAGLAKGLLPIMAALTKWIGFIVETFIMPIVKLINEILLLIGRGLAWIIQALFDMIKGAWMLLFGVGKWIFENIIVPAFSFLLNVGLWIWEQVLKPAFSFLNNVGKWIWDQIIVPGFNFFIGIGEKIWNFIKTLFWGTIDVIGMVWGFIKGLFKGSINVLGQVWEFLKSLFVGNGGGNSKDSKNTGLIGAITGKQIGGVIPSEGTYMLHKGERVLSATERNPKKSGGDFHVHINIDSPTFKNQNEEKKLVEMIENRLKSELKRRVSYV